ncbi:MAG: DNA-binding response regulator, OmpR family, containings and winged-helix [Verrucomicrobiales bacterium]|nr:DNA-binding response regulator, OmpR family, containings and winged-helix [Verrucomicrobiales bacterium]
MAIDNARLHASLQAELQKQRSTQQALRESEAFSRSILDSTADCIKVIDREGRILSMNSPGLALFDLPGFEAVDGKPWPDMWPDETRPAVRRAIEAARMGGLGRFQGLCPTALGVPKWWDVVVSPLRSADGAVDRLTATSRDMTDLRRAQEELQAAHAEAQRQSRIKDEFLATLSHELRTPLQSILGWTQILQAGDFDAAELAQGLEVIDRNAEAQTRISEDLLDMNRILSGKIRLDVQQLNLADIVEEAVDFVKPAALARRIRLQSIIGPLARHVSGDPNRLRQIFWNLLTNAIKFTPPEGAVQITLERVNSHLEISVADSGEGIDPEFLPHVFERFRQADASTTRKHAGLGLGLAIVKHLAELHGGGVRAKSAGLSKGSVFTVSLPLAPIQTGTENAERRHPHSSSADNASLHTPRVRGLTFLVVDDEADARAVIAHIISKAGSVVRQAGSAREALAMVRDEPPDVLVSDIGMPEVDGYALIRAVRGMTPSQGGNIPAIALTAYTRAEDRIKAVAAGFQMHISKPADGLELLTMIESLAGHRKDRQDGGLQTTAAPSPGGALS